MASVHSVSDGGTWNLACDSSWNACVVQIGLLDLKGLRRLINLFERRVSACTTDLQIPLFRRERLLLCSPHGRQRTAAVTLADAPLSGNLGQTWLADP